jgi:hypothetical protein
MRTLLDYENAILDLLEIESPSRCKTWSLLTAIYEDELIEETIISERQKEQLLNI